MKIYKRYFSQIFISSTFLVISVCSLLIYLIDLSEILKKTSNSSDIGFHIILNLALLKLPATLEEFLPIAILFGTLIFFYRLSKNYELITLNASGLSIWQILSPCLFIALLIGILSVLIINPISLKSEIKYSEIEKTVTKEKINLFLSKYENEFWSYQKNSIGPIVINSKRILPKSLTLINATFYQYNKENVIINKIDSRYATYTDNTWKLEDVKLIGLDLSQKHLKEYVIESDTDEELIYEDVMQNYKLSIWQLNQRISDLKKNDLNYTKHLVNLHFLIAFPAFLCSMVLVAATLSVKLFRVKHLMFMILFGIIIGFLLFVTNYVSHILSINGIFNPLLGAWWHITLITLISLKILLKQEDG
tara:strand:- start:12864 stop:13952 length:1089 start_codon:yes stop_codon:yes gene_type:complete